MDRRTRDYSPGPFTGDIAIDSKRKTGSAVTVATAAAYTAAIATDVPAEHPGAIATIAAPARCVTLFPAALVFAIATVVVDRSSLLDGNANPDASRDSCARATTTTTTTIAITAAATDATNIATTAAAAIAVPTPGGRARRVESRAGLDPENSSVTVTPASPTAVVTGQQHHPD